MEEGDRPARVRQPVDEPPRLVADPAPERAGDEHGEQQVERHGAEADPERAVGAAERNGTTASSSVIGTYPSPTVATTWTPTSTMHSRERLRCRVWERNRVHRSAVQPAEGTVYEEEVPVVDVWPGMAWLRYRATPATATARIRVRARPSAGATGRPHRLTPPRSGSSGVPAP